jgi:hypothetical protein
MHQTRRVAALLQNLSDPILLAKVFALQMFDSQTGRTRRQNGMIPPLSSLMPSLLPQTLGSGYARLGLRRVRKNWSGR